MNDEQLRAIQDTWRKNADRADAGKQWEAVEKILEQNRARAEAQRKSSSRSNDGN